MRTIPNSVPPKKVRDAKPHGSIISVEGILVLIGPGVVTVLIIKLKCVKKCYNFSDVLTLSQYCVQIQNK